tara:strand:+ start:364 stop:609 length:246 start_codon:yes stop_codon:yes gene_type:complete
MKKLGFRNAKDVRIGADASAITGTLIMAGIGMIIWQQGFISLFDWIMLIMGGVMLVLSIGYELSHIIRKYKYAKKTATIKA